MTNERKEAILDMAKKVVGTEINGITVEDVEIVEVTKSDGVKEGLLVKTSNGICPTLYLTGEEDELKIFDIIEKAIECVGDKTTDDLNSVIRDKSQWRLSAVNLERCRENGYLNDKAYIEVLDLAFIPTVQINTCASVKLSEKALDALGISITEFLKVALDNTQLSIKSMRDVLKGMMFPGVEVDEDDPMLEMMLPPDDGGMKVSVDPECRYGATLLVNEELLQKTREEMGNFYIIPSSIYEVILVKEDMADGDSLREMIGSVNDTVVSAEDFLSNNAYYYDGKLQIAA